MVTQSFCPLLGICSEARSIVLGRTATTGRVRSALTIRTTPAACTSIRATWAGASAIAATDNLSAQFARRIYPFCVTGNSQGVYNGKKYF